MKDNQVVHKLSFIDPSLLKSAEFIQYENSLLVKLSNGKLLVVKDFFNHEPQLKNTQEIETPPPLDTSYSMAVSGDSKTSLEKILHDYDKNNFIHLEANQFTDFINNNFLSDYIPGPDSIPAHTEYSLIKQFDTSFEMTISGDNDVLESLFKDITNLGEFSNPTGLLTPFNLLAPPNFLAPPSFKPEVSGTTFSDYSVTHSNFSNTPSISQTASTSIPVNNTSAQVGTIPSSESEFVPLNLNKFAGGMSTLGSNGSSLSALGGDSSTSMSLNNVDGINGYGNSSNLSGSLGSGLSSDGISGALGIDSHSSLAPPSDAFAGSGSGQWPIISHVINFDGQIGMSLKDMHWDALTHLNTSNIIDGYVFGYQHEIIDFKGISSDTYSNTQDLLVFSDSGDWIHKYSYNNITTHNDGGSDITFSWIKLNSFNDITAATQLSINYTLAGPQTLIINLTIPVDEQDVVDQINTALLGSVDMAYDATLTQGNTIFPKSADGFRAVWDGTSIGIANYYNNVTITGGDITGADGSSFTGSYTGSASLTSLTLTENNIEGGNSNYFQPNHLHPSEAYIIYNTNLSRYSIRSNDNVDDHFALSGANNSDFVSISTGEYDIDTLSFYLPGGSSTLPGDPNINLDPNGNGDYDLVTFNAYTKINNIEVLEARGYGTNNIVLSQAALKSAAEEMKMVNGSINTNSDYWTISVAGDATDTVTLSDETLWTYNGIIDDDKQENVDQFIFDQVTQSWMTVLQHNTDYGTNYTTHKTLDSTRDQYGHILYQFEAINGSEKYYLNVSADILDHPDWYWTGTVGNDALELPDTQFGAVDFGTGTDTLELFSGLSNKSQDLTGTGTHLSNVEILNFTNTYKINATASDLVSTDTITLDKTFVTAATDSNNTLSLIGDNADDVSISDIQNNWNYMGTISGTGGLNAYTFKQYKAEDNTTLNVELEMTDTIGTYYSGFNGDFSITPVSTTYDAIDGGTGTDSLGFDSAIQDFTSGFANISNIEVIEGNTHVGATTITINHSVVDTLTDSNNTLSIIGESGTDNVVLSDSADWSFSGIETGLGGLSFYQYKPTETTQTSVLNIQSNLASMPGIYFNPGLTSGVDSVDDKFTAPDLNFSLLNGGHGIDWLLVDSDDYNFTTPGVAAKINDLEIIDARGDSSNNTVTLNLTSVVAMTNAQNSIAIIGDVNDAVSIDDLNSNWSRVGHVEGIHDFAGLKFYQYMSLNGNNTINIWDGIVNQPDVRVIGDIGGASHDILSLETLSYSFVDGLTGTDTLKMNLAGQSDFSNLGNITTNIEAISSEGIGSGMTLSSDFVDKSSSGDYLVALGDNGDTLSFSDAANWSYQGYIDASGPWPALHAYKGDSSGDTVWLYADIDFGSPIVDALGTSGNDFFSIRSKEDANIEGGSGFDTLQILAEAGTTQIDFSSGKTISNIELLDINNSSADHVTFNLMTVNSTSNNSLYVKGDANLDKIFVAAGEDWHLEGRSSFTDAPDMYLYQNNSSATNGSLYIQTDLLQALYKAPVGTASDDILNVLESDFGTLNGLNGNDRVHFLQEGMIDITQASNTLDSVEIIDTTNNTSNTLKIDAESVVNMASNKEAYILGDNSDNLQLEGNWKQGQSYDISNNLTLDSYTSTTQANGTVTILSDNQINTTIV